MDKYSGIFIQLIQKCSGDLHDGVSQPALKPTVLGLVRFMIGENRLGGNSMALPVAGEDTNVLKTNIEYASSGWKMYREPNTMLVASSLLAWCGKLD